ncbi:MULTISPECIES: transcriptional repressor LexA [unclassified Clostridium]|uniref:transcriptional repressor LexA n=1 Tax=unclassified Clostridium TaxID=2614128 RepID=UPI000297A2BE|nr:MULTISPECIES: transcriptional repressor LexA [unclassified Clostridium]EKQ57261.1 MAG: SOS regulatory protein LexA [Clostridium sp. Maddingley MBC34-26]
MEFNREQKKILRSKPNGHMLIKGEKGTGKTTTFINKIPSLLNNYCITKDDKILIATYSEEVSKDVSFIYKNIETEKYHQSSFFDEDNSDKLEISTIDSLIMYYFNQYKKNHKKNFTIASLDERQGCLNKAIMAVINKNNKKKLNILDLKYIDFIQKEITWIKSCNFTKLNEYQNANRSKKISNLVNSSYPKVLRKNSEQRQAIFEIFNEYNKNLNEANKVDDQDLVLLALKAAKSKMVKSYVHIFIDDSQMLTKAQLEFLGAIYNKKTYSSITFIMDTSNNNESDSWLTNGKSFASLGYDMKGKSITLKTNYSSVEIKEINESNDAKDVLLEDNTIERDIKIEEPLRLDTIKYIDLKRNIHHNFIKDSGNIDDIYIEYNGIEEKVEEVVSIPVFSEIAAGSPIPINEYMEDNYYLPKEWIRSSKDTFMLKVKGDSMINKNICDGDYVVIIKQGMPKVKDIVAVDIDGEATLKTYNIINRQVVLMPENEKYEPIFITDQQFSFLGVAIGLVKN